MYADPNQMQRPGVPPGVAAVAPCAKMELHFKAHKLADMDTFSKSDPYAVLFRVNHGNVPRNNSAKVDTLTPVGRTEMIKDDLNPVWKKTIEVDYLFEQKQEFVLKIWDDDGNKRDEDNDSLGTVAFQLSHIVGARNHTKEFKLTPRGSVSITAVEVSKNPKDTLELTFQGLKMKKMDTFGQSDPYLIIYRKLPNGTRKELYKTEVCKVTLSPQWKPCVPIRVNELTGADFEAPCIEVECWDKDMFSDDSMGSFTTSFNELMRHMESKQPFSLHKTKSGGKKSSSYGDIHVTSALIHHFPTFTEYLSNGWEINLNVSVDFTGSNGDPRNPKSLHYMDPNKPNQYVQAIMQVGDILMEYDSDKMVPSYGFGAILPGATQPSHFFNLNLTPDPNLHHVQGILNAYGAALPQVRLYGPTNFAPTIRAVTQEAKEAGQAGTYTVLLILTDGNITDMDQTIGAIVAADDAPLSIVIVGVGSNCDFEMMDQLDGDDSVLCDQYGRRSRRDLVQFVPMKDFLFSPPGALAGEVLREIPDQFVRWAEICRVKLAV